MSRSNQVGTHKTSIYYDMAGDGQEFTAVIYHSTPVVKWNGESIILNTGGWFSNTTKLRMNQASNQFNLGYQVYQRDWKWYVDYKGQTIEFNNDTLKLER